jgi:hypothetical protein
LLTIATHRCHLHLPACHRQLWMASHRNRRMEGNLLADSDRVTTEWDPEEEGSSGAPVSS